MARLKWSDRSKADQWSIIGATIGGCIAVFFAVEENFLMRFVILAGGAAVGWGLGRSLATLTNR